MPRHTQPPRFAAGHTATRPLILLWLGLLACAGAGTAAGAASLTPTGGLSVESGDGDYSFELGGRVMWDGDSYDGVLNLEHDGERRFNGQLRRARIEMSGNLPSDFDWKFDVNFLENGDAEVHAAGLRYSGWRFANVFVGRDKEPFSLEELTSSKAISTIRRNFLVEATDADNQPHYGVRLDGFVGPVGWSAGLFNPNGNPQNADGGDRIAFTGRLFGAPLNSGDRVLHLGAAYSDRNLDEAELLPGFAVRAAESADRLPSSLLLTREDRQAGLELLYLHGPFSVQAEQFWRDMKGAEDNPDGQVRSHYLQATWTVTGETRGYKASSGVPDMVQPRGEHGAIELVAKAERIVFDRGAGADPEATSYLVGANWYANRAVKLMFDVSWFSTDDVVESGADDDSLVFSGRIQVAI